jgi:hypothetical protein
MSEIIGMSDNPPKSDRERPPVLAHLRFQQERHEFDGLSLKDRFAKIYAKNLWGSPESLSGLGSEIDATSQLRSELPKMLRNLKVQRLLDVPCGDFTWMSRLSLKLEEYIGGDIVQEIVEGNSSRFENPYRRFVELDLTQDTLPEVELILCRDCLVHLSFGNIFRALANMQRSKIRYLLTTTFPDCAVNEDITDGDWRLLNLQLPPFNFPVPQELINEECTECEGAYRDKSLGLWRLEDLPDSCL